MLQTLTSLIKRLGRTSKPQEDLKHSSSSSHARTQHQPSQSAASTPTGEAAVANNQGPKMSLRERVPRGAWDSHMHVVDTDKYKLAAAATYQAHSHTIDEAMAFESSVGIDNIVLVQPSTYGNDNECLFDAMRSFGPGRARGVVSFDPAVTPAEELQRWHNMGVRGVRINVQSTGMPTADLPALLQRYADAVRPFGWVVQVYVPMHLIEALEPIVPNLRVRFCIDHLGYPDLSNLKSADPYDMPGFASLVRLLEQGSTFVKLSGPYRISKQPSGYADVEAIIREIVRVGGMSRVVFATDWPHTRFDGLDIRPWMETVLDMYGNDEALVERLFKGNAEDLWDAAEL